MALVEKILVPIDPSPASTAALEYAASLAEQLGARVDAMHVHAHDDFKVGSMRPLAPDVLERAECEMAAAVDATAQRLGERFTKLEQRGDPATRILETVEAGGYDLVVMGTHGRVGRLHALIGSVAEGVVRNAPCPVLTVRVPEGRESFAERIHDVSATPPYRSGR